MRRRGISFHLCIALTNLTSGQISLFWGGNPAFIRDDEIKSSNICILWMRTLGAESIHVEHVRTREEGERGIIHSNVQFWIRGETGVSACQSSVWRANISLRLKQGG